MNSLVQSDYTQDSWTKTTQALALPETTQTQINAKIKALNLAIKGLITQSSFNNLNDLKTKVNSLVQSDYTQDSWTKTTQALALPETTQTQINTKIKALNNAINGLVKVGGGQVDTTPPTLKSEWYTDIIYSGDPFSGKFTFSEPISSIGEIGFFSPDGIPDLGGSITSYSINGNELSFTGILPGSTFQLYIKNAKDMSGNTTPEVKGGIYNPS